MRKPNLPVSIFKNRRHRVSQLIKGSVMIVPAWPEYFRNADNHFGYRPDSDLLYLTGFDEPDACLILKPGYEHESILFVRQKNEERETWDGFRYGVEAARSVFGVDRTYPIEDIVKVGQELIKGVDRIYYTQFRNTWFDEVFKKMVTSAYGVRPRYGIGSAPFYDAHSVLGEMRIIKADEEVGLVRRTCAITADAHVELMKATKPGVTERALHGLFIKSVMEQGAFGEAYGGIVATGDNATTLHYRFNECTLESGQLLLVDCGAEYQYYSGDITRTYPVSGRFSTAQKRVYQKVLNVQKRVIEMVKPGAPYMDLQTATIRGLTEILIEEGLIKGSVDDAIQSGVYTQYYPHGVTHLLGMDTHDAGLTMVQGKSRPMEPGWVITIEPGLYFPAKDSNVPDELKGIGIRIEDDVLVTQDGCEIMTRGAPKEIEEIEALVGSAN